MTELPLPLVIAVNEKGESIDGDGKPIQFESINNGIYELSGDDLLIETQGAEGWAVTRESGVTVALDTTITPELRSKGLAREVINRIQNLRKQANFEVTDRISVAWAAEGELADAILAHQDWIAAETLASTLKAGNAPDAEASFDDKVAEHDLAFGLSRVA